MSNIPKVCLAINEKNTDGKHLNLNVDVVTTKDGVPLPHQDVLIQWQDQVKSVLTRTNGISLDNNISFECATQNVRDKLRAWISGMDDSVAEYDVVTDGLLEEIEDTKREMLSLSEQVDALNDKINDRGTLEAENLILSQRISELEEQLESLENEKSQRISELEEQLESLENEKSVLLAQLTHNQAAHDCELEQLSAEQAASLKEIAFEKRENKSLWTILRNFQEQHCSQNNSKIKLSSMPRDMSMRAYLAYVNNLPVNSLIKKKLFHIADSYNNAFSTARKLDPDVTVPSQRQVVAYIMGLGTERLIKIGSIMGKPELIIDWGEQFDAIVRAMDANPYYPDQGRAEYWSSHYDEDFPIANYAKPLNPEVASIGILDMIPNPAIVADQNPDVQTAEQQLRACMAFFLVNGMQLANKCQYAVGIQQSLREIRSWEDKSQYGKNILDFGDYRNVTKTFFHPTSGIIDEVGCGWFNGAPYGRVKNGVYFTTREPESMDNSLRGRGYVPLF